MSLLSENPAVTAGTGGLGLLLVTGVALWRLGAECERGWLDALAAPPEPFETAAFARMREGLGASAALNRAPSSATREAVAA